MNAFLYDLNITLAMVAGILAALAVISYVALRGWRDWIALRREELSYSRTVDANNRPTRSADSLESSESWIELADLRERLRKLEAIAAGVDL